MEPEILSFEDAMKASGNNARSLLLGNGFSIAQGGGQFSYGSLLEKSGLAKGAPIRNVFDALKTFDFEKVMKALENASQVELAYGDKDRAKKFNDDAGALREALISA